MQSQLVVTADNHIIEELKTVIEGFIGQQNKSVISIETKVSKPVVFDDIRQLKGILNQYHQKPLTDEEIEHGIHQGIIDRAMTK